jgi:hypothetical protein
MFTVILRTIFSADTVRFEPGLWVLVSVVLKGERIEGSSMSVGLRFDFLPLFFGWTIQSVEVRSTYQAPCFRNSAKSSFRLRILATRSTSFRARLLCMRGSFT